MLQDEISIAEMPDVTRSDSQRSDTSLKPRVSFNRDVHVKRIGTKNYMFYHVSKMINQLYTKTKYTNKGHNVFLLLFYIIVPMYNVSMY